MSLPPKQLPISGDNEPERGIAEHTRTLVVGPYTRDAAGLRPEEQRLEEAVGLAQAIDLAVVRTDLARIVRPRPATLIGLGKVEEYKALIEAEEIDLVLVDGALTPVQQRNLERGWGCKVIDRTGLILEIFGRRARTREGVLQVELAHLAYQKSRLVRSWTHLERQRGGFGFLGGPGETQIEADRRMIVERMRRIEHDLEKVKRTRALHRAGRERVPYPTIALVGYTNAGKSTLFNRLSSAEVLAKDMLFATLDPTARVVVLPHGLKVILLDTVGFISDLPTTLIAAFRATLEDVIEADIILHVRDLSHQDSEAQASDVAGILSELGIDPDKTERLIEVWNKADRIAPEDLEQMRNLIAGKPRDRRPVLVSALAGEGIDVLRAEIERRITASRHVVSLEIGAEEGAALNWLHESCEVLSRVDAGEGRLVLELRIPEQRWGQFTRRFAGRFTMISDEAARTAR